jgi:hypothetical protein
VDENSLTKTRHSRQLTRRTRNKDVTTIGRSGTKTRRARDNIQVSKGREQRRGLDMKA